MELGWIVVVIGLQSILFISCSNGEVGPEPVEQRWSIYYEFLKTFAGMPAGEDECAEQVLEIFRAINEGDLWALKALDASGSVSSSFIYHHNFWHGSKTACELPNERERPWMTDKYNVEVVKAKAPFKMKYFTIFANYSTSSQFPQFTHVYVPFQLGVCAPGACTKEQVLNAIKPVLEGGQLPFQQLYNVTFTVFAVKTPSLSNVFRREYTVSSLVGIVTAVTLVLVINLFGTDGGGARGHFVNCFNLQRNYNDLISTTRPKGSIECLDGIRSVVCIWIILLHLPYFSLFSYKNSAELLYTINDLPLMILFLATYSLDTFFVISGLLLTYNFLNNEVQRKVISRNGPVANIILFAKLWLHRYVRLTPAFLLTMTLSHLSSVYMEEATHLHVAESTDNTCPPYSWWRGMLYVHSLYPIEQMCGFWTWYLSCEMLYFSVSLAGLFMFVKSPSRVKFYFLSLLGFSVVYSFYVNNSEQYDVGVDVFYRTLNTIYIAPLVRMSPYLVGIMGGYLLHSAKDSPLQVNGLIKLIRATAGVLAIVLLVIVMKYFEYVEAVFMQIANSIGRFIFSVFLVGSVTILTFENGGIVKAVLCSRLFAHLSKLSYMMYLLQPLLVYAYRAASESSVRADVFNIYTEGLGILVICYFASFSATLFFEIPYCRLSSEFLKSREKQTNKVSHSLQDKSL